MASSWKGILEVLSVPLMIAGGVGGFAHAMTAPEGALTLQHFVPYILYLFGGAMIAVPILLEKFDDPS